LNFRAAVPSSPHERLFAFCRGEFAYYDAIPSADPNRIEPIDVLVTVCDELAGEYREEGEAGS
jgi:hypothetical protein